MSTVSLYPRGRVELRKRLDQLHIRQKATIAPVTASDAQVGFSNPEVFESVRAGSIIGKMPLLRRLPFLRRLIKPSASSRGYWVGGSVRAKPLSRFALEGTSLSPLTVAVLMILTDEAIKFDDPLTDAATQADVTRALIETLDASFIDVSNAGVADVEPASITSTATQIPSTGNPAADVAELISNFRGDLASAHFTTDPLTATRIGLARDTYSAFEFPDAGPRGGSILGIPLIVSRGSPNDVTTGGQLALIDASAIAVAIEGVEIERATGGAIQMSDTPDNPVTSNTTLVSLFQSNLTALRGVMHANFEVQREGAVAVVTGAQYSAS